MIPYAGWELAETDIVVAALERAWRESFPRDPDLRHEEGGWIYQNRVSGDIRVVRAASGIEDSIDLSESPVFEGDMLVATFHTHPNPEILGWRTGPNRADTESAWLLGVPCIIKAEDRVYVTGPGTTKEYTGLP